MSLGNVSIRKLRHRIRNIPVNVDHTIGYTVVDCLHSANGQVDMVGGASHTSVNDLSEYGDSVSTDTAWATTVSSNSAWADSAKIFAVLGTYVRT